MERRISGNVAERRNLWGSSIARQHSPRPRFGVFRAGWREKYYGAQKKRRSLKHLTETLIENSSNGVAALKCRLDLPKNGRFTAGNKTWYKFCVSLSLVKCLSPRVRSCSLLTMPMLIWNSLMIDLCMCYFFVRYFVFEIARNGKFELFWRRYSAPLLSARHVASILNFFPVWVKCSETPLTHVLLLNRS